jgi:hypothetical protein
MQRLAHLALRAGLLLLPLLVASCDGSPGTDGVTFGGVEVRPTGGTTLALSGGALVVSGVPAGADGGLRIDGVRTRIDVEVDPVTLPAGGRFGTRVEAADGSEIASMFAEGLAGDQLRLAFSFATASAVTSVRVLYKLDGVVLFEIPSLRLTQSFAPTLVSEGTAGTGEGKAGSVHAIRQGGRYIVVSDSEGSNGRPAGAASGCPGFLLTPPDVGGVPPPNLPLCVDWVEVQPLDGQAAEGTRTSVLARGIGRFTVRTLAVR